MKLSDLLFEDEYVFSEVDPDTEITKITLSPSDLDSSTMLIVLNSERTGDLYKASVAPAVTLCGVDAILPDNFPSIRAKNPRLAMAFLYYRFEEINLNNIKLVGVTGTNGKTSTALFIKNILSDRGHTIGFIGTGKIEINNKSLEEKYYSMTTPDPPLLYKTIKQMKNEGCDTIVMEVSSHALALDKLAPLEFDYGVFTNLSGEHLDFHKTKEEYFSAKRKLIKNCKKAIINIDDSHGRMLYEEFSEKSISAGILWRGDVWAGSIKNKAFSGCSYLYHAKNFHFNTKLSIPGEYNIYNAMLATTVCIDMGIKPCEVKYAIEKVTEIPGRFEIIEDDVNVVIDYAHTHVAFYNIMKELSKMKGKGQLCVIFGCGGERDKSKRPKMAEIAEKYADRIIVTTDNSRNENPKDIISDIIKGFKNKRYEIDENRAHAIRTAITSSNSGDLVAVIGKGCERYNIDKNGYCDFNEKDIIISALSERRA